MARAAAGEAAVYGVNTGFGKLARVRIPPEDVTELQRRIVLSHMCGVGAPLDATTTRLVLLLKASSLALGHSGVRPATIDALLALLAHDALPLIPYPIAQPDGSIADRFWSATHTPFRSGDGRTYVLQHTVDVTELTRLREAARARDPKLESGILERAGRVAGLNLALSQEREYLRSLFAQAPSFMAVLHGRNHVFELANDYIGYVGDRAAYELGGYQTWTGLHSFVEPGTGQAIVAEAVGLLEQLHER